MLKTNIIVMVMPKDPIKYELARQNIKLAAIMRSSKKEVRERVRLAAIKRYEDPKQRQRQSELAKDRKYSAETRKKMSDSHKRISNNELFRQRKVEGLIGGFWYGNVKYWYVDAPQYCEKFNKDFKERVRAYRGYQCFECGVKQTSKKLQVHHVHYDKKMCCNGSPRDVVPLCASCHTKTNFNRDEWEEHFTNLIYLMHPEGKCFFTREEMSSYLQHNIK